MKGSRPLGLVDVAHGLDTRPFALEEAGARVLVEGVPPGTASRCVLGTPTKGFMLLMPLDEALQELGFSPADLHLFRTAGTLLRVEVFRAPAKHWSSSTWFNMIGCVCRAYAGSSEVGTQLQPLTFDLLRTSLADAEQALGVTFERVLREGPAGESWMSLARFRALPGARAAHARLFLCCVEGIGPSYRGDGFVGRADGQRGAPEIIGPAAALEVLTAASFRLPQDVQPRPARRRYTAPARRAPGGRT